MNTSAVKNKKINLCKLLIITLVITLSGCSKGKNQGDIVIKHVSKEYFIALDELEIKQLSSKYAGEELKSNLSITLNNGTKHEYKSVSIPLSKDPLGLLSNENFTLHKKGGKWILDYYLKDERGFIVTPVRVADFVQRATDKTLTMYFLEKSPKNSWD